MSSGFSYEYFRKSFGSIMSLWILRAGEKQMITGGDSRSPQKVISEPEPGHEATRAERTYTHLRQGLVGHGYPRKDPLDHGGLWWSWRGREPFRMMKTSAHI